jgi:hypothetical protein
MGRMEGGWELPSSRDMRVTKGICGIYVGKDENFPTWDT